MTEQQYLDNFITHKQLVLKYTTILGKHFLAEGNAIGIRLIANGYIHDIEKFLPLSIKYFSKPGEDCRLVSNRHYEKTQHHPEYWEGIQNMPELFLAEMVCDWMARSMEYKDDIFKWMEGPALKRYNFTKDDEVYNSIIKFINIINENTKDIP